MARLMLQWSNNAMTVFDKRMKKNVPKGSALPIMGALFGMNEAHTTPQSLQSDLNMMSALWDCSLKI